MMFTLVFKGSVKKVENPLRTETPFGIACAVGIGDAFERIDQLEDALREAGVDVPRWQSMLDELNARSAP